jgi:two-component system alkaline phosphatase synthesis response regulator PhoP
MGDKILVVEDELEVRMMLKDLLGREGFEVILASDGEEGVELADTENPQVILLDISMPGMDGVECCRKLKADNKTSSIPVIMLTAHWDRKTEAIEAGADDFVHKPFDPDELSFRVKSVLRVRYLNDELNRLGGYVEQLKGEDN